MTAPVKPDGIIWNGDPLVSPPPDYKIGTIELPDGFHDLLFENQVISTGLTGNFYLCMSSEVSLAKEEDMVPNRNTNFDIFLFCNKEIGQKIIKRRKFQNNANEIIIRFEKLEGTRQNFYSGNRKRNIEYIDEFGDIQIHTPGMHRLLIKDLGNGEFSLAVEAGSIGTYTDGFIKAKMSDMRGKFIITNSIFDQTNLQPPKPIIEKCEVIKANEVHLKISLGGNTFLFRSNNFGFKAKSQVEVFGNIFEYPLMEVPYIFDMPAGFLYFHCNVLNSRINEENLVTPTAEKDLYKNRFKDNPIINYYTYFPVEEEHTIHHHEEKVSIVDDIMEDLYVVDRTGFDAGIPFDIGSRFDSRYGIPFDLKEQLQNDIFFFDRKGRSNKGDAGAICLSYSIPIETVIEIASKEDFINFINSYTQNKQYNDDNYIIIPSEIRNTIKLIFRENIELDFVYALGLWMGRHGKLILQGYKKSDGEFPIVKTIIKIVDGRSDIEVRNIKIDGKITLGSAMRDSILKIFSNINQVSWNLV